MSFENIPTPKNLNDFLAELNIMMSKWTAEGNKDVEPSLVMSIKMQVETLQITPEEGIRQLYVIDNERIER
ncbi:MAG: hypothetical protein ACK42D_04155 [Candidatus Paceibacteria bacterium]